MDTAYDTYPTALFLAEQRRFYRALRSLPGIASETSRCFFGFDVDAPGDGYEDVGEARDTLGILPEFWNRVGRVEGETLSEEADRLEAARDLLPDHSADRLRVDLDAMIGTMRYAALAMPAADYKALRPAMAMREELMKRHVERVLDRRRDGELVVLMGHAFHLVKDDRAILTTAGVGPGGGLVPSLGHHLAASGRRVRAVWMLYGGGEDSQPFPDLPTRATYPPSTLNAELARSGAPLVLSVRGGMPEPVEVGHMYNAVASVHLDAAVDAIHFVPSVTPLRAE